MSFTDKFKRNVNLLFENEIKHTKKFEDVKKEIKEYFSDLNESTQDAQKESSGNLKIDLRKDSYQINFYNSFVSVHILPAVIKIKYRKSLQTFPIDFSYNKGKNEYVGLIDNDDTSKFIFSLSVLDKIMKKAFENELDFHTKTSEN